MPNRFFILILLIFANISSAQEDLLACVDPDVREGLLFGATEAAALVTRTVPDVLAGLPQSGGLQFIGSSVSALQTLAAYKSTLAPIDAMAIASEIVREAGWREFGIGGAPSGGFVTGLQPRFNLFCREDAMLNVMGSASGDTTYVRLQVMPKGGGIPCGEMPGSQRGFIAGTTGRPNLYEHMPTLALPDRTATLDPRMALVAGRAGFSGTDRSVSTEIDLETDLSAQDLVEHFGQQLEEQGWSYDAGWSSPFSDGSVWTRSPSTELDLVGLLDVIALGNSGYRATFRASSRESD